MAANAVFELFEVREGFGPREVGPLRFESESRADADRVLEDLAPAGATVQLFGLKADHGDQDRVLLRILVGLKAA